MSDTNNAIVKLSEALPAEYQAALAALAQKTNPRKKGLSDEAATGNWSPPILKIKQPTSRDPLAENLKSGEMYTSTGEAKGSKIEVIVLYRYITHARWKANDFSSPDCSSPGELPGHPRLSVFGTECSACPDLPFRDGQPTACSKNMVYWVMDAKTNSDIYVVQFSKTSYKTGAELYKLAKAQQTAWHRKFILSSVKANSTKGVFYNFNISLGEPTDEPQQKIADSLYEMIHEQRTATLTRLLERRVVAEKTTSDDTVIDVEFSNAAPKFKM